MCWFYLGIVQIALDPHPPLSNEQTWKKVPQTTLASPYTPGQRGKKVPQTILASLYAPVPPYGQHTLKFS